MTPLRKPMQEELQRALSEVLGHGLSPSPQPHRPSTPDQSYWIIGSELHALASQNVSGQSKHGDLTFICP
jgi:hypothetical protein